MSRGVWEQKRIREAEAEARSLRALTERKKALTAVRRANRRRRKSVDELLCLLALDGIRGRNLRPAETFESRSYNLERQLHGLLCHLFVRYPVPSFMFQACLTGASAGPTGGAKESHERLREYRHWFVAMAQDGSFPKLVKHLLTGREASAFLSAPAHGTIYENLWWAKMHLAGVAEAHRGPLIERIFASRTLDDKDGRSAETLRFYARFGGELDRASFDEVTDFLAEKLRRDPDFSLKGRTASSVIRLSNEWHREVQYAKLGRHVQWKGLEIPVWTHETKTELWDVVELLNNKDLLSEGRKQKHCVYSYVPRCVAGQSAIFSVRAFIKHVADCGADGKPIWGRLGETRRVTIEVNAARRIVQVRGPLNRAPCPEEIALVRRWASANELTLPETGRSSV